LPVEDGAWTVQTAEISDATNKEDSATVKKKKKERRRKKMKISQRMRSS